MGAVQRILRHRATVLVTCAETGCAATILHSGEIIDRYAEPHVFRARSRGPAVLADLGWTGLKGAARADRTGLRRTATDMAAENRGLRRRKKDWNGLERTRSVRV